jgi:hypothetical protein
VRDGWNQKVASAKVVPYGDEPTHPCRHTSTGGRNTINIGGIDHRVDYTIDLMPDDPTKANDVIDLDNGDRVKVLTCVPVAGNHHKIARCTTALDR